MLILGISLITDYGDAVVQALWIENYERDRPGAAGPALRPVAYAADGGC